jgi:hypothetical protein
MKTSRDEEESSDGTWGGLRRVLAGYLPAKDGKGSPVVRALRGRLAWVVAVALGLLIGAASAFLVVLILYAAPGVPGIVVGFAVGAMFGGTAALILASRLAIVRKWGALAILLFPVLVLLGPFLLLAGAVTLLRRGPKKPSAAPAATVEVVESRPASAARRPPGKKAPRKPRRS